MVEKIKTSFKLQSLGLPLYLECEENIIVQNPRSNVPSTHILSILSN